MSQHSIVRSIKFRSSLVAALLALSILMLASGWRVDGQAAGSAGKQELPALELNQPVERQLAGGETHRYRLMLSAGQYIKVEAFQYWISVELRLFDPAGQLLQAVKLHSDEGQTEVLSALAERAGDFRLEVKANQASASRSHYTIKLVRQQLATGQERQLVTADRMQVEAFALSQQGKGEEAVQLSAKAIAVYEQVYGAQQPELAEQLRLLSVLQASKGDYAAVEVLHKRVLALREQALGHEGLEVAESLRDLAEVYYANGQIVQAKALYTESLRVREKLLPMDDLRIAQAANNLGNSHRRLGEFAPAEQLLRRGLTMQERVLEPEHSARLKSMNDLAARYATQGDFGRAEPLFTRVAEVSEKFFPSSPQTGRALLNLGRVNVDLDNMARAEPFVTRALALYERMRGPEHADVADVLMLQGRLYLAQSKLSEAEQAYDRARYPRENLRAGTHVHLLRAEPPGRSSDDPAKVSRSGKTLFAFGSNSRKIFSP